jgi:WD40 repeat protein
MSSKLRLALVLVGTLPAFGAGLATIPLSDAMQAESPAEKARVEGQARTDLFGDLLPPGALARMGTIRYAQGDSIDGSPALAPDHTIFATVSRQTPYRQGRTVCLWDATTGKELQHIDDPNYENYQVFFLKHENLLGTLGISRKSVRGGKLAYAVQFWDPKTGKKAVAPFQVLEDRFDPWALSADEKLLVSASWEPPVVVRERKTGKVLAKWNGERTRLSRLAFSPDGKTVAIGTENSVYLWDWQANREVGKLSDFPKQSVLRLWFSPDGRWLAAAIFNEGLRVWDTKRLTEGHRIQGEYDVRFFPDGKRLVSATTGKIWDVATGKQVGRVENCAHCLTLDIAADGRSVAGYALGRFRRWDADTGKDRSPSAPPVPQIMIHQVGFLPDGKSVVSASPDGAVRVWDAATGKELRTLAAGAGWEPQHSAPMFLRVAADGTIVTARGKRLAFFRVQDKAEEIALEADAASLNLSPDGKSLILTTSNRLVQIGDIASRKIVIQCTVPKWTGLGSLGVTSDRNRIAAYINRAVVLLNLSGDIEQVLEKRSEQPKGKGDWDDGYSYFPGIQAFAFSPTGDVLASSGHLGALKLLDVRSGKARHVLTPPKPKYQHSELRNVVFSPNGRMIAAESADGVVDVWETSTGQRRHRFVGHRSCQTTLAFSPDGMRLASGNRDATILIWDVFGLWTDKAADAAPLAENELPALWARLREGEAEQTRSVLARLMRNPTVSAPFLKQRLLSRKEIETPRLRAWIADLDDADFQKRETASRELAKHLPAAEPLLKECLANKPSLEVRRRIENLLALVESHPLSEETIRDLRALEVMEYFGLTVFEDVAQQLADGNYDPHIATAAKAACQRLKDRKR